MNALKLKDMMWERIAKKSDLTNTDQYNKLGEIAKKYDNKYLNNDALAEVSAKLSEDEEIDDIFHQLVDLMIKKTDEALEEYYS